MVVTYCTWAPTNFLFYQKTSADILICCFRCNNSVFMCSFKNLVLFDFCINVFSGHSEHTYIDAMLSSPLTESRKCPLRVAAVWACGPGTLGPPQRPRKRQQRASQVPADSASLSGLLSVSTNSINLLALWHPAQEVPTWLRGWWGAGGPSARLPGAAAGHGAARASLLQPVCYPNQVQALDTEQR